MGKQYKYNKIKLLYTALIYNTIDYWDSFKL